MVLLMLFRCCTSLYPFWTTTTARQQVLAFSASAFVARQKTALLPFPSKEFNHTDEEDAAKRSDLLLARRIQRMNDPLLAFQALQKQQQEPSTEQSSTDTSPGEDPCVQALRLCYRHANLEIAQCIVPDLCHTDACRQLAIQISGKYHLQLANAIVSDNTVTSNSTGSLRSHLDTYLYPNPTTALLNAALAACQAITPQDSIQLLQEHRHLATTLSYNIVLKQLSRTNHAGKMTLDLLHNMSVAVPMAPPDRSSYHHVLNTWLRNETNHADFSEALRIYNHTMPRDLRNSQTLDLMVRAAGKRQQWKIVQWLEGDFHRASSSMNEKSTNQPIERSTSSAPSAWQLPTRVKKPGQAVYWVLGQYSHHEPNDSSLNDRDGINWTVAVQFHRHSRAHGLQLQILQNDTKVAHLILKTTAAVSEKKACNDAENRTSCLLGLFIDPKYRRHKWTRQILGLWIHLCNEANLPPPQTDVMRKPLLCLVLQHQFQFRPISREGVVLDIFPGSSDKIRVYSPNKCLDGVFSPRQKQDLELLSMRPQGEEGRRIHWNARLQACDDRNQTTPPILPGTFTPAVSFGDIQRVLLVQR